jgi:hypothetical protein
VGKLKLDSKSYANLLDAERKLLSNLPEFDRLDECGSDCSELRAMTQTWLGQIAKMKEYYSP